MLESLNISSALSDIILFKLASSSLSLKFICFLILKSLAQLSNYSNISLHFDSSVVRQENIVTLDLAIVSKSISSGPSKSRFNLITKFFALTSVFTILFTIMISLWLRVTIDSWKFYSSTSDDLINSSTENSTCWLLNAHRIAVWYRLALKVFFSLVYNVCNS